MQARHHVYIGIRAVDRIIIVFISTQNPKHNQVEQAVTTVNYVRCQHNKSMANSSDDSDLIGNVEGAKVALVAGATGLVGKELIRSLLHSSSNDWALVYGVARHLPPDDSDDNCEEVKEGLRRCRYQSMQCDLLDQEQTTVKLGALAGQVTHLFWTTWASQFHLDTPECCAQNRTMLANTLNALVVHTPGSLSLRHICLQTGTKHYRSHMALGLTGPYHEEEILEEDKMRKLAVGSAEGKGNDTWYKYDFYHAIEKLVMEWASQGFVRSWSVHRPGLLFGASNRSYFNVMGSLCVYASLCRHLGMPFHFHGTRFCWEERYIDLSDARLVAKQQIWWASSSRPNGNGEAFNAVGAAPFVWKQVWPALASRFGVEQKPKEMNWLSEDTRFVEIMHGKERAWDEIVAVNGLRKTKVEDLANWGFLDLLFRSRWKLMAAPGKAKSLGFVMPSSYTDTTTEVVLYWIDCMREMRFIP